MGRRQDITSFVKRFDPLLFCESKEGKLCLFRKGTRVETYDVNGTAIDFLRPAPHFVFALTHDWNLSGDPCDRGLEQIRARLVEIDLWNRDLVAEIEKREEEREKAHNRELDNHIESYLLDHRREFAKATNDVNTASMSKADKRKKDERKLKNGNC